MALSKLDKQIYASGPVAMPLDPLLCLSPPLLCLWPRCYASGPVPMSLDPLLCLSSPLLCLRPRCYASGSVDMPLATVTKPVTTVCYACGHRCYVSDHRCYASGPVVTLQEDVMTSPQSSGRETLYIYMAPSYLYSLCVINSSSCSMPLRSGA